MSCLSRESVSVLLCFKSLIYHVAFSHLFRVLSIYGDNLSKLVDQSVIIDMLKEEGYPTSLLYVN